MKIFYFDEDYGILPEQMASSTTRTSVSFNRQELIELYRYLCEVEGNPLSLESSHAADRLRHLIAKHLKLE